MKETIIENLEGLLTTQTKKIRFDVDEIKTGMSSLSSRISQNYTHEKILDERIRKIKQEQISMHEKIMNVREKLNTIKTLLASRSS